MPDPTTSWLIKDLETRIMNLESQIRFYKDSNKLLLDYLNLEVQTIPAQPAQQKLLKKGIDGKDSIRPCGCSQTEPCCHNGKYP